MEETLTVKILGETKQLTSQLSSLKTKLNSIGGIASSVTSATTAALKKGAKAVAAGSAAIGASIVAITKKSVEAYSSYEQLVGGVDKLYGEASATVQKNADAAYATTGFTANEYMEMATSYAAALNASLNGNVQKSAKVTDMAIKDMADNASIFGSSMESIQNAYNGFAKQNYTMLDNLKLGYGGTEAEMARLLEDAEKISGVKYDMENLSDVYNAIHVIQQELKITGNAAAEASKTIEGSANATKAAWGNLLVELAKTNGDVTGSFSKLAESALNLVNNVIPVISRILEAIKDSLPQILRTISSMTPSLMKLVEDIISTLFNLIIESAPEIVNFIGDLASKIALSLIDNLPVIVDTLLDLGQEILDMLIEFLPDIVDAVIEVIPEISEGLMDALPQLLAAAAFLITELLKEFPKYMKSWAEVGVNIVAGIWKGLSNSTGWIKNKIKEWVGNVLDFFKELFGIHSPSTVFEGYGEYMVEGLTLGVEDKKNEAILSFEDLRDETDNIYLSDLLSQIEEAEETTVNEVSSRGYTGWQVSDFGTHFPISRETVANFNGRRGYLGWQVSDFGTHFPSSRETNSSTEVVLNVDGTTLARAVCQNINQITADTGTMPLNIY